MKKYLLTAIAVAGLGALVRAEIFPSPVGQTQALASADYGGVYISTSQFNVNMTTIPCVSYPCKGVVYGAIFSTGNFTTPDFVRVFDATSATNAGMSGELFRLYNVGTSTGGIAAGFSGVDKPIKYQKGLFWQLNTGAYNSVGLMYYQQP